jgi:Arc/MetJ-type ribon-helix-helix transcriptional regulator
MELISSIVFQSHANACDWRPAGVSGIARESGAYYAVNMRTISVKLPDELLAQLGREAKARRVTKSSLVRESLEKSLHGQLAAGAVSCYDLARDLAGSSKGLPKDLAENPKYMEGFGQ